MDRLLGRNEGSEGRDFTDGRRYGEEQRFFDEPFSDERDPMDQRDHIRFRGERDRTRGNFNRSHRTQASQTRRHSNETPDDFRRDYNVRYNMGDSNSQRGRYFGKGPKGWKRSDERVKEEVSETLYRDYHIDASEIEVDVKDGVVTLSGTVDSRETKRMAEDCIDRLSGVVDIHNRIRIQGSSNVSNLRNGSDSEEKRSLS